MWRNVAVSMLTLILLHVFTTILPAICAPLVSTVAAVFLYYQVVFASYSRYEICGLVPYAFFIIVVSYTVVLVAINLLNIWGVLSIPNEMVFFDMPYLQSLVLAPIGLITSFILFLRRHRLTLCINCKITNGSPLNRGRVGAIYSNESTFMLRNLIILYTFITSVVYAYYLLEFQDVTITSRDRFIFSGVVIFAYLMDIAYFGMRYYNLFLDLQESDELLTPNDVNNLGTRTYVRYYVICDDSIYMAPLDQHSSGIDDNDIIDSPFVIKRTMSAVQEYEIKSFIEAQTGVKGGELRFFYGRKTADAAGRIVLRYFYFLPGETEDYPQLAVKGSWISSDKLKTIYNNTPDRLTNICLADISRIAMVTVTRKTYHLNGERRTRLTHYRPSFSLREIQHDDIDFQDDAWVRVAMFNSDTSFFKVKRWWRKTFRRYE